MWYCDYDDLDKSTVDYLLSVSGASKISDLTMAEINNGTAYKTLMEQPV